MIEENKSAAAQGATARAPRRLSARRGLVAALALVCAGCAGARVENLEVDPSVTLARPVRIIVYDFNTGPTDVEVLAADADAEAQGAALSQQQPDLLAEAVADSLAARLVERIRSLDLPAERIAGAGVPEVNDLVIEGDFVRVDPGSRALRLVVGLGLGASELRTRVRVFHVTADGWRPVQQFEIVATSSRLPGAAFGIASGAAAGSAATSAATSVGSGAVRELRSAIDAAAGRTAQQIAARLSELQRAQGW